MSQQTYVYPHPPASTNYNYANGSAPASSATLTSSSGMVPNPNVSSQSYSYGNSLYSKDFKPSVPSQSFPNSQISQSYSQNGQPYAPQFAQPAVTQALSGDPNTYQNVVNGVTPSQPFSPSPQSYNSGAYPQQYGAQQPQQYSSQTYQNYGHSQNVNPATGAAAPSGYTQQWPGYSAAQYPPAPAQSMYGQPQQQYAGPPSPQHSPHPPSNGASEEEPSSGEEASADYDPSEATPEQSAHLQRSSGASQSQASVASAAAPPPTPLANSFRSMNLQDMSGSAAQQQQVPREVDILMGCETGAMPLPAPDGIELPTPRPHHQPYSASARVAVQPCTPEVMRSTLNCVPQTSSLLNKVRLPLGLLLQPFRDLPQLQVIQTGSIVRCRSCRSYINPYVSFVENRRWRCNICPKLNDVPEDFLYDPTTKTWGDPFARPEVRSATIEYIAPADYMVRPPQPAIYVFLLDVSPAALALGYMEHFCRVLRESLEKLPGDARSQLAVVTYDASSVHLYVLQTQSTAPAASVDRVPSDVSNASTAASEQSTANSVSSAASATHTASSSQAASTNAAQNGFAQSNLSQSQSGSSKRLFRMLIVTDIDDLWEDANKKEKQYLPEEDAILVNVQTHREAIGTFLDALASKWAAVAAAYKEQSAGDEGACVGTALEVAYKLTRKTGGRITVVNASRPTTGLGVLPARERDRERDPRTNRPRPLAAPTAGDLDATLVQPQSDYYKRLGLECEKDQVGVDLFQLGGAHADLASLAGTLYYYAAWGEDRREAEREPARFAADLRRYLTRKIGFEAVMRIRCTQGLAIQTFFGNMFVRSTDLLNLANVSPDQSFAVHLKVDETLEVGTNMAVQCALLYTSSKGDRRIRVHTLLLPVSDRPEDILAAADQQAIVSLLAKMAAEKVVMPGSASSALNDSREALVNAVVDMLTGAQASRVGGVRASITAPYSLRLLPLYVFSLLKTNLFRWGASGPYARNLSLDERFYGVEVCRTWPSSYLLLRMHPALYLLDFLDKVEATQLDASFSQSQSNSRSSQIGVRASEWPPLAHLSASHLSLYSLALLDAADSLVLVVGSRLRAPLAQLIFGAAQSPTQAQLEQMADLPALENSASSFLRRFIQSLRQRRPFGVTFAMIRDDAPEAAQVFGALCEDRQTTGSRGDVDESPSKARRHIADFSYPEFIHWLHAALRNM